MRSPALLLSLAPLTIGGCAPAGDSDVDPETPATAVSEEGSRTEGTRKMAERLAGIIERSDPVRHITAFEEERLTRLRAQVASAPDEERRLVLRMTLGHELLVDGRTAEAIAELEAVQDAFDRPEVKPSREALQRLREWRGVAYLRQGEEDNCLGGHNVDSCLMPMRGGGVHTVKRGATAALAAFTAALNEEPQSLRLRWLLNVTYMVLGRYPDDVPPEWLLPPKIFASEYELPRFLDVAPAAGVGITTLSGGVVLDDFDADGLLDILTSDWRIDGQLRFFVNAGDGTFDDRTEEAGLVGEVGGLNLVQADYDNDGHLDALVLRGAWMGEEGRFPNSLLRNTGEGGFDDVTEKVGLLSFHPTQTAAWADYDGDGWLDLFVGNESPPAGKHPCELYQSRGDGTFREVAARLGVAHRGFVKGVSWGDYDNDGRPDLYLSCFGQPNLLFHNEGEGGFRDVTEAAGVSEPRKSFPTWFWDFDNDGWQDILVAPFSGFSFDGEALEIVAGDYLGGARRAARTALHHNRGDGTFVDVAHEAGIDAAMLAMGANFGDVDGDGWLDAYFGTGDPYLGTLVPNRLFRNDGEGGFQDATTAGGFGHVQKGHGIAFGDLDGDGDEDVYAVMGGSHSADVYPNALFENPTTGTRWLTLRLEGERANRSAIGARIRVRVAGPEGEREIHRTVTSGGSFGASSLQQEIGLGHATSVLELEIRWPGSGTVQTFDRVPLNAVVVAREGQATLQPLPPRSVRFPSGDTAAHEHEHEH